MKKLPTIISIIILIILGVLFVPLLYAENYFNNNYSVGAIPNIRSEVFQSKFDVFNPEYAVLLQLDPENGKQGGYIVPLKRNWLVLWEIDTENITRVDSNGISFDEFVQTAKENDLSKNNPKPENISINDNLPGEPKSTAHLSNEELYFTIPENRGVERTFEDFKKLQIDMKYQDTTEIIGKPDVCNVNYKDIVGAACHYSLTNYDDRFIEIVFNPIPAAYPDRSTVKNIKIIYTNRTTEDLPLE